MNDDRWLAEQFEANREPSAGGGVPDARFARGEADDAVQEAWMRLSRADTADVENLRGWLSTVVGTGVPRRAAARASCKADRGTYRAGEPSAARRRHRGSRAAKRRRPIRSVSRCSWCSRHSRRPSGARSSCTTCSPCPSMRSHPSWADLPRRRGNSRATVGAACKAPRCPTPIAPGKPKSSTLRLRP